MKTKKTNKPSKLKNSLGFSRAKKISLDNKELTEKNFVNMHWDMCHALLNNQVTPSVANAVSNQTARILGFKKLEIERARLLGGKITSGIFLESKK